MNILGISNTKDSGAALIIDGVLIAAVNEERFNRSKLTRVFPIESLQWIQASFGIRPQDLDAIGIGAWKGIGSRATFARYVKEIISRSKENPHAGSIILERVESSVASDDQSHQDLLNGLTGFGLGGIKRFQCHHHYAHAVTAAEFSPFDEALVVTLDGRGDFMSGSVSVWSKTKGFSLLRTELEIDSLGAFYGWITAYLGFTPDRHEGKVTGLAAAGRGEASAIVLRKLIQTDGGTFFAHLGPTYAPHAKAVLPVLRERLAHFAREDIAAGAQMVLEELVTNYISYYVRQTGSKNICLAGGLFANVLLNMKIRDIDGINGMFVFPHMGDGGISVGGAGHAFSSSCKGSIRALSDVYLGPEYGVEMFKREVNKLDLMTIAPADLSEEVANLLVKGLVIGIFQGRTEFGPRALGNRSILASAAEYSINEHLNKRLSRSEFMPFAPVTMKEFAHLCYLDYSDSDRDISARFMTACYRCSNYMRDVSPAVVHLDGTARPQIISREDNAICWSILEAYYKLTKIPSLINTSFNEHETPIVNEPHQALEVLVAGGIDALVIPPFIIRKPR